MRLLNTETGTLEYFEGVDVPQYAILSHRWGSEEVSYQDYGIGRAVSKSGYRKIVELCKLAKSRSLLWAWIDTCCIDKASSAELTESINSMWSYYRNAAECYAYLADVPEPNKERDQHQMDDNLHAALHCSEWFKRGWTLQELIAPKHLLFCTSSWSIIGSKAELAEELSNITRIRIRYLQDPDNINKASVAMRMSWAANRKTTRIEDIAYSLLGLFDVNMPLLYGEGMKAFMRLQKKLIKKSDDESIFAWQGQAGPSGMLAQSPAAFANSNEIVTLNVRVEERLQYQLTNKGLELRIPQEINAHHKADRLSPAVIQEPNDRRARSTSPLIGDRSAFASRRAKMYASSEIRVPNVKDWKRIQLACGKITEVGNVGGEVTEAGGVYNPNDPVIINGCREKYGSNNSTFLFIALKRTENGWQRVKSTGFEWVPEFTPKDDLLRVLYQVPQEGL
jgi:hypothetical protein